jgi:hypothetical protein
MSDLTALLERFSRGAELIAVCITGAAGSELDFVPQPGKWSIRQIVCHLADSEMVGAERFRRVVAEDNPVLLAFDQDAWARHLDYGRRKITHALESFRRLRGENHELLKELPESAFVRAGIHTERGPLTLRDLVVIYAEHAEKHAIQIRETRAAFKTARAAGGRQP